MDAFLESFISLEGLAAIISMVVTILAFVTSFTTRVQETKELTTQDKKNLTELTANIRESGTKATKTKQELREQHLSRRIEEVELAIKRFQRQGMLYGGSNNLLVFGQYIIGAALASSFVQQSVSNNVIGILGVVVLLATTIHQRLRPDERSRIAYEKVGSLRATTRRAQDQLVTDSPDLLKIIKSLSQSLNRADRYEEIELEPKTANTTNAQVASEAE